VGLASAVSAISVAASEAPDNCHLVPWGGGQDCGFPAPSSDIFFFDPYLTFNLFGITFNIDKPIVLGLLGSAIIITFFVLAFRKPKLVPGRLQLVGEYGYTFIRDGIAREVIGKEGDRYVPLLFSMFFFVWMMNLWGIIPFAQFPVSSHIAWPAALTLIVWILYMYLGVKHQGGWGFFRNMMFPPGLPKPIYVLLAPIELLSNVFVRPFTLTVRLFANMFAGHLLLTVFAVATFYLLSPSLIGLLGSAASFAVSVILTAFEMFIQALQAYIFTLLTAVYIAGSLHAEH
jgi:F-type H+-transporting ATPase subunit a